MKVHEFAAAKRKARRPRKPNSPVEVVQVDRRVWKEALKIAKGDPKRIKIISRTRVEIR